MGYTYNKKENSIVVCPFTGFKLKNLIDDKGTYNWNEGTIKVFSSNSSVDLKIFISEDHSEYPLIIKPAKECIRIFCKLVLNFPYNGKEIIAGIKKDQKGEVKIIN